VARNVTTKKELSNKNLPGEETDTINTFAYLFEVAFSDL